MSSLPVLAIENLSVLGPGRRDILCSVSLDLPGASVTAVVGETGSAKSTLINSILGLLPVGLHPVEGTITIADGESVDLLSLDANQRRKYLGVQIGYVPQDVRSGLNPLMSVRATVREAARRIAADSGPRVDEALRRAGLSEEFLRRDSHRRPTKLSGGQCQRVLIAQAIVNHPRVLLLDEPTASLDPLARNAVLETVRRLTDDGCAVCLVTHDIAAAASVADYVAVMYLGSIVESGSAADVLGRPQHPYTRALVACVPRLDRRDQLVPIPGSPTDNEVTGCKFHPRCPLRQLDCDSQVPLLRVVDPDRKVACHVI